MSLTPILTNLLQLFWHRWKIYRWHCIVDTDSKFIDSVTAINVDIGKDVTTSMGEGTIKTQNPKCRLYWCLIEFIDWRHSQSCLIFDLSCELLPLYLLSDIPFPLPPSYKITTPPQTKTPGKTTFRDWCFNSSFVHDYQICCRCQQHRQSTCARIYRPSFGLVFAKTEFRNSGT